ncbi:hypothetical protein QBC47DRAFT_356692 [Echria macrotheca]|uniref:Uncharacterized protein n=1 Tax=Echria macrotheca TaxID=438768 RepID=A0AAJ0BI93_9PEZI|nr:hypothetical protein QBC47DRAFT_356692 [Echria macrotheca]
MPPVRLRLVFRHARACVLPLLCGRKSKCLQYCHTALLKSQPPLVRGRPHRFSSRQGGSPEGSPAAITAPLVRDAFTQIRQPQHPSVTALGLKSSALPSADARFGKLAGPEYQPHHFSGLRGEATSPGEMLLPLHHPEFPREHRDVPPVGFLPFFVQALSARRSPANNQPPGGLPTTVGEQQSSAARGIGTEAVGEVTADENREGYQRTPPDRHNDGPLELSCNVKFVILDLQFCVRNTLQPLQMVRSRQPTWVVPPLDPWFSG